MSLLKDYFSNLFLSKIFSVCDHPLPKTQKMGVDLYYYFPGNTTVSLFCTSVILLLSGFLLATFNSALFYKQKRNT